jgi:hypothetical protein
MKASSLSDKRKKKENAYAQYPASFIWKTIFPFKSNEKPAMIHFT